MKRNQIVPPRGDGRDLGWRWGHRQPAVHYWRSRTGTSVAISHCGLVWKVDDLGEPIAIARCGYCDMIEGMRDTAERASVE